VCLTPVLLPPPNLDGVHPVASNNKIILYITPAFSVGLFVFLVSMTHFYIISYQKEWDEGFSREPLKNFVVATMTQRSPFTLLFILRMCTANHLRMDTASKMSPVYLDAGDVCHGKLTVVSMRRLVN